MSEEKDAKKQFNEAVTTVKLLLSSLFARKQPKMILSYTQLGVFYFTNIDSERIALYKATPEDILSRVKIVNEEILNILYTAFPFMKESVCEINVSAFSSALNKHLQTVKDKFPDVIVDKDRRQLAISYTTKEGAVQTVVVGKLLAEWDYDFYTEVLNKFHKFSNNVIQRRFMVNQQQAETKVSLEIVEVECKNDKAEFGFPISDGLNLVSAREYIKKRKLDPWYDLMLQFDEASKTSKATIRYLDDWIDACTIMPGSLWFMTRRL